MEIVLYGVLAILLLAAVLLFEVLRSALAGGVQQVRECRERGGGLKAWWNGTYKREWWERY